MIILAVVCVAVGYFARDKLIESFTPLFTDKNGTLFSSSKVMENSPPTRFYNVDFNSMIRHPPNESTTEQCTDCTQPEVNPPPPEEKAPSIIVDRLVFANRNSRLRGAGDPIRGDLPFVPTPPGWFSPSVNPQIDLQRGALNFIAGENLPTMALDDLFSKSIAGQLPSSVIPLASVSGGAYAQLGNRGNDLTIVSTL